MNFTGSAFVHLAALALTILTHATVLAFGLTVARNNERLEPLHYYVRTLHDRAELCLVLKLQDNWLLTHDALRQVEVSRLVSVVATARELLLVASLRHQWTEVAAVD